MDKQHRLESSRALDSEAFKSIKALADLDDFRKMLNKVNIETALNAHLDEHLVG
ncbi:hypothetical protein [Vibrio coralliirubri]|uniref:hypothetical protein n=1 Tax=Vibrio coralliirubri TaxID=1516159 RepID=UPI003B987DCD